MERIKEAIEKAKAAQKDAGPTDNNLSVQTSNPPGILSELESTAIKVESSTVIAPIQYKHTRVVDLNARHLEAHRIISFTKTDARTSSFDRLRTQLMQKMKENSWRTLAVTSPTAGCGKTTLAINLSMSIAHQTEQTVLLADLDLRNPKLASYLGLQVSTSLTDYLNDDAELFEVFVNPNIPRLTLLPNHKSITNAAEVIMTSKMKALVTDMRNRYETRMVIFDLPALLTTDDALAFLPHVDCVLMVVENGVSTKSQIRDSFRLLQNTPVLGTVLNKAERL
ncbi:MAG: CpsD/CapB family tyrosine-protein kinase [Alphaproteobacteria bacterium]